jgi:hypothetical protein
MRGFVHKDCVAAMEHILGAIVAYRSFGLVFGEGY